MKFFKWMKDGGPESKVWGLFLIEIKSLFSIVLLNFKDGSREAYHDHAFSALTWILKGQTEEHLYGWSGVINNNSSWKPIITPWWRMHKVVSKGDTWAISFRGPWRKAWKEYLPQEKKLVTLTTGRKILDASI